MAINLVIHSRLRFSRLLLVDGVEFWDLWSAPTIPVQNDDLQYTVQSGDRIDLLANRFYSDPVLWWVIASANSLDLMPSDLISNATLRIPSPRYVLNDLFKTAVQ